jgi:hypothetical protein
LGTFAKTSLALNLVATDQFIGNITKTQLQTLINWCIKNNVTKFKAVIIRPVSPFLAGLAMSLKQTGPQNVPKLVETINMSPGRFATMETMSRETVVHKVAWRLSLLISASSLVSA